MTRIPGIGSTKAADRAARIKDVLDRERAARPVDTGRDTLRKPVDGMDERFGFAADSDYLR
jgi:hypothetical protein